MLCRLVPLEAVHWAHAHGSASRAGGLGSILSGAVVKLRGLARAPLCSSACHPNLAPVWPGVVWMLVPMIVPLAFGVTFPEPFLCTCWVLHSAFL